MATFYVSSVAGDNTDGLTWAKAKTSVAAALALATASGDIIYVDSAHVFAPAAAITWDAATADTYVIIISVNRNGSTTTGHSGPLAGAKETVGANAAAFNIALSRSQKLIVFGCYIEGNNGASTANLVNIGAGTTGTYDLTFYDCTFSTPGTAATAEIVIGTTTSSRHCRAIFKNPVFIGHSSTNAAAAFIATQCCTVFMSGVTVSYAGANKPPIFIRANSTGSAIDLEITNSDLNGYNTTSGAYFSVSNMSAARIVLRSCKTSSTPTITSGTWVTNNVANITSINADSGDTKTVFEFRNRLGTLTESESIYADAGAQIDTTRVSWQIVTTAACNEAEPFITPWSWKRVTSTSAQAVGFRIAHDSATDLHDRNLWPEIEYVSSASFPLGSIQSGRNAAPFEGSAADWTNGSDAWTGIGGFGNQNKQTIEQNVTPAEACTLGGRLFIGVASKTLYVDPLLRVT